MPLPDAIRDRIELFARNEEQYRDPSYKEAQLRQEFLDPLFAALGWDMDNRAGHAESYKDVIHEDAIKIGSETKAPDYSFRIGGTRKFFVEAKKPSVLVKDDPAPAYQLRRYSWSAKLPLGILTDFQEFAIYDTRVRPVYGDKAHTARLFYCTYEQLPEKWDEIAGIFAKDSVLRGSFDKYAATTKGKRGTATVDVAFLEEIERWRELLARHLALRNESLSQRDLNFVVQRLIDRLIFLRIAEDRGLEPFGQLQALTAGNNLYPRLREIFERADFRYNSGLFHFEKDADCTESPDRLSLRLELDDAPLKDVLKNLYYPASPYVFSVIPADILGSVYERFLGKVIHLTETHKARIEEKPEVRKAGGVYYTPTYIVDYIVRQTVGTLVADKTPKQIEKLRVLDPACGSGSFLIGAYQFLLDWYLDYYAKNDPEKWSKQKPPRLYETNPNAGRDAFGQLRNPPSSIRSPQSEIRIQRNWQLTTAERRRILLAHIHGVDIDAQAVEVTKLSLLLKVLEGEARETQGRTREMSAVLPDLGTNIRCGNSLVGHDFYAQPDLPTLDDEARLQLNTFDWAEGFPEIMRAGGFDAVIGNPPYGADVGANVEPYIRQRYDSVANSLDTFILFMEKAGTLLRSQGRIGVIIPSGWVSTPSCLKLRRHFSQVYRPESFVSLPYDVFAGAYIDTMIVTASRLQKGATWASLPSQAVDLVVFPIRHRIDSADEFSPHAKAGSFESWLTPPNLEFLVLSSVAESALVQKLRRAPEILASFAQVMRGIETYHPRAKSECKQAKPALTGDVLRYSLTHGPAAFESYTDEIAAGKPLRFFSGPRVLLRQLLSRKFRLQAVYAETEFLTNQSMQSLIPAEGSPASIKFVLAVLNSRLLSWYFCQINLVARRDDFPKTIIKQTRELPFPRLTLSSKPDRERHDRLVELVDTMLALHAKLSAAQSPDVEENLRRQIIGTDKAIDALVYALYGLTPEEIALVESATAPQPTAEAVAPNYA